MEVVIQSQPQKEPYNKDIDYNYAQTRTPTRRPQDEKQTLPADDPEWQDIEDEPTSRPEERQANPYQLTGDDYIFADGYNGSEYDPDDDSQGACCFVRCCFGIQQKCLDPCLGSCLVCFNAEDELAARLENRPKTMSS